MKTYTPRPTGLWFVTNRKSDATGPGLLLDKGPTGWLLSGGWPPFAVGVGWMYGSGRRHRLRAKGGRNRKIRLGGR